MNLNKAMLMYAVTDRFWTKNHTLLQQIQLALEGGATCIQLREKELTFDEFYKEAVLVKEMCRKFNVPFIINDNVELAVKCDADGVHIGQHDMSAAEARKLIGPDKILGVSAQTVEQAKTAVKQGADYLGVGAVFPTETKKNADKVELATLKEICSSVSVPVVAIGGISLSNIEKLSGTSIDGVAVVSAIFGQKDIKSATTMLLRKAKKLFAPKIRGIIFDMDGTLLDSMPYWQHLDRIYLKMLGIDTDEDFSKVCFSLSMWESAVLLKKKFNISKSEDEIIQVFNRAIRQYYEKDIFLKKGVMEFLSRMKNKNIPMVIVTATDRDTFVPALTRLQIGHFFKNIITASEFGSGKDKPEIFMHAASLLGTDPKETIVIEDGLYAIKTAVKAGFKTIGVFDEASIEDQDKIKDLADFYIREDLNENCIDNCWK